MRCEPPAGLGDDNDFHEVWWNSSAFDATKGRPTCQLHEVWQWMGDAPNPAWARPRHEEWESAEDVYKEGWRYVRPIKLLDEDMRMDGELPRLPDPGQ